MVLFRTQTLHIKYKSTGSLLRYNEFCKLRSKCKNLSRFCYDLYMINIENGIHDNVLNFWKRCKEDQNLIPVLICHAGKILTDLQEIADTFAIHFGAVYLKTSGLSNSMLEPIHISNNISFYFNILNFFEFC